MNNKIDKMKRVLITFFAFLFLLFPNNSAADEGMWLPLLLKNQKFEQMRKMGLKLSAEEIYSINRACIKDAVIGLMGEGANLRSFGTASFISDSGLIITNYHVILSYIERFSNSENDFLKYGYWARNRAEESLCRGLQMKQLIRMEDVTEAILEGTDTLTGPERSLKIDENGKRLASLATKGTGYEVRMQALFGNSQYIMSVYEVYRDIRMVAAPPFSIGKFGGHKDNYSWPRHTGDFAVLRVYSNKENKPSSFSNKNVPYKPASYLKISLKGVNDGDFIMVAGFPGSTKEYVPSFALDRIIYGENVHKVGIRKEKIEIINSAIDENPQLRFRYTTRLSSIENSYLRWRGEIMGVTRMDLVNKKRVEEGNFKRWVAADSKREERYSGILERMEELYKDVAVYNLAEAYFNEAGINGSEIVPFIGKFEKLAAIYSRKNLDIKAANSEAKRLIGLTNQFFENWDLEVDRKMFRNMMVRYYQNMPDIFKPDAMVKYLKQYEGDAQLLSLDVFKKSIFTDKQRLIQFLEDSDRDVAGQIKEDPLYQIAIGYYMINVNKIMRVRGELQSRLMELNNIYMRGYLEMNGEKIIYPDANNSQRISYGRVNGAKAQDGLFYSSFTTLDGVNDKYLNNIDDEQFYLPKKVRDLIEKRDYGVYASDNGKLTVNFLTDAHTTSGSSGSPVINSKGELVGLNFDRIWQGVASDFRYDKDISRSIAVDIRYILFILDKYSPSQYVLKELKITK
ncbi:MAG: S46 family peptidase [Bacteroidales bacterium]|nr:S46 family peptidase [Bacteroidales bacterium]